MGSNPIDPATIRATAQRVVDEFRCSPDTATSVRSVLMRDALVQAGADLAAQSHATALADAEREAARRAWEAAMDLTRESGRILNGFRVVEVGDLMTARDRYLAREYPAPAPRECVLSGGDRVTRRYQDNDESAVLSRNLRGALPSRWMDLLLPTDTGADFDALKAFATTEGAR